MGVRTFTFTVRGKPEPKGSARAFAYKVKGTGGPGEPPAKHLASVVNDNPKSKDWEHQVASMAQHACPSDWDPTGPMTLSVAFFLPRPKSLPKTRPSPHVKRPDLSKLVRALEDGLTSVVWGDDSQVHRILVTKAYAAPGETSHAVVTVTRSEQ